MSTVFPRLTKSTRSTPVTPSHDPLPLKPTPSSGLPRTAASIARGSGTCTLYGGVYPAFLPTPADLPSRVNPLHPVPPRTMQYSGMETVEPHWQNERRTTLLKRREWLRYHIPAAKVFYGTPEEKETHRSLIRAVLKQQMSDRWTENRLRFQDRKQESIKVMETDSREVGDAQRKEQRRHDYLRTFSVENQRLMEMRQMERRRQKTIEDENERQILRLNPINWSCTLT